MNNLNSKNSADIVELRRLLVGPDLNKLERLIERLENPDNFSTDISQVLPEAMKKSAAQGEKLSNALVPTVEDIVRLSIKRDINKFANVLFPVIGPAIRKSIAETFRLMMQSMNQVLDYGLSWQGIKWRLESMRSGIPFAQIVLLNSLEFRVEQVFLIHRESGLLLKHVQHDTNENQNADMVSSMLTAIGDFVGDSFDVSERQELDSIKVGDFSIWIEKSPDVILAIAIRGDAPNSLRETLQQSLERIQLEFNNELDSFSSDTEVFEPTHEILQSCLQSGYTRKQKESAVKPKLILGLIVILILYWITSTIYSTRQMQDYIELLKQEPGIILTDVAQQGSYTTISGLRDPLARNPEQFLARSTLNEEKLTLNFEPFHSLKPQFVQKRLIEKLVLPHNLDVNLYRDKVIFSGYSSTSTLQNLAMLTSLIAGVNSVDISNVKTAIDLENIEIPDEVSINLDIDNGILKVTGEVSESWKKNARAQLSKTPGVRIYDDSQLSDKFDLGQFQAPSTVKLIMRNNQLTVMGEASNSWIKEFKRKIEQLSIQSLNDENLINLDEQILRQDVRSLENLMIYFDVAAYSREASDAYKKLARLTHSIINRAKQLSKKVEIILQGHSDSTGSYKVNQDLTKKRAQYVAQFLTNNGIAPNYLTVKGISEPVKKETSLEEQRFNRRVSFRVLID